MEKYCRAGQATDGNMAHAHCMLHNYGFKYIKSLCNTLCFFFTTTMVARTRLHVTFIIIIIIIITTIIIIHGGGGGRRLV